MSEEKKEDNEVKKEKVEKPVEGVLPDLAEKLAKESRRLRLMAIAIIALVIINASVSIATLVLVITRPNPTQFLNNSGQFQRLRNGV